MAHGHHDKKEAKLSKRIFLNINIVIFQHIKIKHSLIIQNSSGIRKKYIEKQNIILAKKIHLKLQISTKLHLRNSIM